MKSEANRQMKQRAQVTSGCVKSGARRTKEAVAEQKDGPGKCRTRRRASDVEQRVNAGVSSHKSLPDLSVRVYYEDTDAGGVVYYANYLRFAERARSEAIRFAMKRENGLWLEGDPLFVARHLEADYIAPARLDDLLTVSADLVHIGGASFQINQTIKRGATLLVDLKVTLVTVSQDGKVLRLPPEWRQNLSRYLNKGASLDHGTAADC